MRGPLVNERGEVIDLEIMREIAEAAAQHSRRDTDLARTIACPVCDASIGDPCSAEPGPFYLEVERPIEWPIVFGVHARRSIAAFRGAP